MINPAAAAVAAVIIAIGGSCEERKMTTIGGRDGHGGHPCRDILLHLLQVKSRAHRKREILFMDRMAAAPEEGRKQRSELCTH